MSEHDKDKELSDILEDNFNYHLNNKHFHDFGIIKEYNSKTCMASIQPAPKILIDKGDNETEELEQTIIHNVPVIWTGSYGGFVLHSEIKAGDKCLIIWTQNDNQNYKGDIYNIEPHRMFSYNNATCIPINTLVDITQLGGIALQSVDGSSYINLLENGEIKLKTKGGLTHFKNDKSILFQNGMTGKADGDLVTANGTSLDNHGTIGNLGILTPSPKDSSTGGAGGTMPPATGEIDISPRSLKAVNFTTSAVDVNSFYNAYNNHYHVAPVGGGNTGTPQ